MYHLGGSANPVAIGLPLSNLYLIHLSLNVYSHFHLNRSTVSVGQVLMQLMTAVPRPTSDTALIGSHEPSEETQEPSQYSGISGS